MVRYPELLVNRFWLAYYIATKSKLFLSGITKDDSLLLISNASQIRWLRLSYTGELQRRSNVPVFLGRNADTFGERHDANDCSHWPKKGALNGWSQYLIIPKACHGRRAWEFKLKRSQVQQLWLHHSILYWVNRLWWKPVQRAPWRICTDVCNDTQRRRLTQNRAQTMQRDSSRDVYDWAE